MKLRSYFRAEPESKIKLEVISLMYPTDLDLDIKKLYYFSKELEELQARCIMSLYADGTNDARILMFDYQKLNRYMQMYLFRVLKLSKDPTLFSLKDFDYYYKHYAYLVNMIASSEKKYEGFRERYHEGLFRIIIFCENIFGRLYPIIASKDTVDTKFKTEYFKDKKR